MFIMIVGYKIKMSNAFPFSIEVDIFTYDNFALSRLKTYATAFQNSRLEGYYNRVLANIYLLNVTPWPVGHFFIFIYARWCQIGLFDIGEI